MNIFSFFEVEFQTIINQLVSADLLSGDMDTSRVVFELPRDESHGDLATNAAMVLAKQARNRRVILLPYLLVNSQKLTG